MKTFKFLFVLRTRENTDFFITLDDNIYGIHNKRVIILYICVFSWWIFKPLREKTYPLTYSPKEENHLAHSRSLISVFVYAKAQADLNFRWAHMPKGTFSDVATHFIQIGTGNTFVNVYTFEKNVPDNDSYGKTQTRWQFSDGRVTTDAEA